MKKKRAKPRKRCQDCEELFPHDAPFKLCPACKEVTGCDICVTDRCTLCAVFKVEVPV
jgi:hypothetical protein